MINPSHLIKKDITYVTPDVNWDRLRDLVIHQRTPQREDFPKLNQFEHMEEWQDTHPSNESVVGDVGKRHRWQSNFDDGQLDYLMNGTSFDSFHNAHNAGPFSMLRRFGYGLTDKSLATRLFLTREKQLQITSRADLIALYMRVYEKEFGKAEYAESQLAGKNKKK